ncbi:hypothetical protein V8B97DRAFT_2017424 [Scleroderma yunnanense]
MGISSFFSSFLTVVHADASEEKERVDSAQQEAPASAEEPEPEQQQAEAEAEEEEPEDVHPVIREECKNTSKCAPLTRHFEHCQEKVTSGQGYKGEDCVEEL